MLKLKWMIPLVLVGLIASCTTYQPPEKIRTAIATINRYTPEYVTQANKALSESGNPDAERLLGIGLRLQQAIDSLNKWANTKQKDNN